VRPVRRPTRDYFRRTQPQTRNGANNANCGARPCERRPMRKRLAPRKPLWQTDVIGRTRGRLCRRATGQGLPRSGSSDNEMEEAGRNARSASRPRRDLMGRETRHAPKNASFKSKTRTDRTGLRKPAVVHFPANRHTLAHWRRFPREEIQT
jgi:hypothetical protein